MGRGAVRLWLIHITGFSVNMVSNHCGLPLQDSTEHFSSTGTARATCTRTLNLHYYHTRFCAPFRTFMIYYSQHSLQFSPTYPPLSHLHPSDPPSNGQWEDSEWLTSRQCLCPVGALSSDYSPKDMAVNWGGGLSLFGGSSVPI